MNLIIISLLLAISLGFNIQTTNIAQSSGNLKATNYTGESITSSMVSFYIKTINDAYSYYGANFSSNTDFIQSRLESTYSAFFDVIIMPENVTIEVNWIIYSTLGSSTVSWYGVNTAKPNWVYIINLVGLKNQPKYIGNYSYGIGMNATLKEAVVNILQKAEGTGACACINMERIHEKLQEYDGNRWSVICKRKYINTQYSRIRVSGDRFIFTYPNTCQYLVWTI